MTYTSSSDLLTTILPANRIATRPWLLANGLSKDRLDNHVKSGRLRKLARGVFCHRYAEPDWLHLLASFGESVPLPVYVGGLSALREAGFVQYLNLGNKEAVALYSPALKPHWLKQVLGQLQQGASFHWHKTQRIWPELNAANAFQDSPGLSRSSSADAFMLASPERAFIELLDDVPKHISFEHADEIMQGLMNLSPRKLEPLLMSCNSVKAKRLFCWLADRHQHSWWKRLDYQAFNLGAGKRVIQQGGRLDSRYKITVPVHMQGSYLDGEEVAE